MFARLPNGTLVFYDDFNGMDFRLSGGVYARDEGVAFIVAYPYASKATALWILRLDGTIEKLSTPDLPKNSGYGPNGASVAHGGLVYTAGQQGDKVGLFATNVTSGSYTFIPASYERVGSWRPW